jgi:hypothetical protein
MFAVMRHSGLHIDFSLLTRLARATLCILVIACAAQFAAAQDTTHNIPLLSGGVGFYSSTSAGSTAVYPIADPLIAAPLGKSFLVESRATLFEYFSPNGGGQPGYSHIHFANFSYLQGEYLATPHLTVVGGSFLLPFNTYNDRLSPIWIANFQDGPLISGIGTGTGAGLGGMLSGSAASTSKYSISYNAWFSASSKNYYFNSQRSSGGRAYIYVPESRLEIGASYDRRLQQPQENFFGAHVWWEPKDTGFRLRSEFSRAQHAQGYWIEADWRTLAFGGPERWTGRFEPVFRMQQTFRIDKLASDGVPSVNTERTDFGLDYNLPHNTRIITSYARQFASTGDTNVWETGIVYRFLFPAWKEKSQ